MARRPTQRQLEAAVEVRKLRREGILNDKTWDTLKQEFGKRGIDLDSAEAPACGTCRAGPD